MKLFISTVRKINRVDYFLISVILLFSFFSYQHPDILHTGASSFAYINGHFKDFYEYNAKLLGGNNYMPTTYILFAIWNIPIRLLGLVTIPTMEVGLITRLWYKTFTTLLYFGTALYIEKICNELKISKLSCKLAAIIFITNPIAVYSQFIFGQYDIITTFFVTVGLYYWLKDDTRKFIAAFAVALTCKYFALLFYIPLLLIKEKNIFKIFSKMVAVCILFIMETVLYLHSPAFIKGVFGFGATSYVFNLSLDLGYVKVSVVVLSFVLLCAYCYFSDLEFDNNKLAVYALNLVTFIVFGLSYWHPQWLLIGVPIWVIGTVISKKVDIFLFMDVLIMFFYTGVVLKGWREATSEGLFKGLVWGKLLDNPDLISGNFTMADMISGIDNNLIFSCFAAILAVYTIFKMPNSLTDCEKIDLDTCMCTWMIRLRYIVGIGIFIIPSLITLYLNYNTPSDVLKISSNNIELLGGMSENVSYDQIFFVNHSYDVSSVSVYTASYNRVNDGTLMFELYNSSNEKIASASIEASKVIDCGYTNIKFKTVQLEPNELYTIRFWGKGIAPDLSNTISLARSDTETNNEKHAFVDGLIQDYNLCIRLNGLQK